MNESRRRFLTRQLLTGAAAAGVASAAPVVTVSEKAPPVPIDGLDISLDGDWSFRKEGASDWETVTVPHTWQVMDGLEDYYGVCQYRRTIAVPPEAASGAVFLEFESVFHSAEVRVNGTLVAEHRGKGYTAFRSSELSRLLKPGAEFVLEVRVDNSFVDAMLPRSHSSDWAHDGGIYRGVHLLVLPATRIDEAVIHAWPDDTGVAQFSVTVSYSARESDMAVELKIIDEQTGRSVQPVFGKQMFMAMGLPQAEQRFGFWEKPHLWHFDHPHLYRLEATLTANGGTPRHRVTRTFGVRKFEAKFGAFHLNGEKVRLMGVERMAGSNPDYGMAEPLEWIEHDHEDLKNLNCVFTRVHWMQDRRLLDWCDRHGILVQLEVPTWGGDTFRKFTPGLEESLQQNGLEQLREMIEQNRHHPCIVAWGLCNEIDGKNPPAAKFASTMLAEAKKLDPSRLCTYASNSLQQNPAADVSAQMDFVSWNQYYGSWYKGGPEDLDKNLKEILAAFPGKPIVISEYGYCACTADRPEGDARRIEVLREQDAVLRKYERVAGLIFFCYNDYRTHIGDRGSGALKQRVHGVVDLYGRRKPSYEVLRDESSPLDSLTATLAGNTLAIVGHVRTTIPGYTLRGYTLEAVAYGQGNIAVERQRLALPDLAPGAAIDRKFAFREKEISEVRVDVRRPAGWSAKSAVARR